MTSEAGNPKRALETERDRIEGVLQANDAWRALRQLDQREAEGRPVSADDAGELRKVITAALEGDRIFLAWRKISEAITLLGDLPQPAAPVTPPLAPSPAPTAPSPAAVLTPRLAGRMVTIATVAARASAPVPASPQSPPPYSPGPPPADDLTLIRGIDRNLAAKLAGLGVTSFDAIAAWTAADVRHMSAALGLDRTIQRQNWIEQAALVALRRRPAPVARPVAPPPPQSPVQQCAAYEPVRPIADLVATAVRSILAKARPPQLLAPMPITPPVVSPPVAATVPTPTDDDLTALRGVDNAVAAALAEHGVTTFAAIAAWRPVDVQRLRSVLAPAVLVVRAQWIEQAAMLAAGQATAYSRTRAMSSGLPVAPRPALTAIARDEGLACDLARLSPRAPTPDPQLSAPPPGLPATAPHVAADITPTPPVDVVSGAGSEVPPRPTLQRPVLRVVVSRPAPIDAEPLITKVDAPRPARVPFALPPLVLAPLPVHASSPSTPTPEPARWQPAVLKTPSTDLALADIAVDAGIDSDGYDSLDIICDEVFLYGEAAGGFGEANVQIVARTLGDVDAPPPEQEPRPLVHGGGAGSLQSRLRKATDADDEFDARGYAAYRSAVEEASVEIVHRAPPSRTPAATAAGPAAAPGETGPGDPAPASVRRFLKSLTGQDR